MSSALYAGVVTHARQRPRAHFLRYRVVQGFFDLDEGPELGRRLLLFGFNRPAPISFHTKDHGDGSGDLRTWIETRLCAAGLAGPFGAVQVLCMPRVFGYVFNPISVYFCHDLEGGLVAMVYEVNNTSGERHAYVLPHHGDGEVRQGCRKAFQVSPFMPMDLRYDFRIRLSKAGVAVEVDASDHEGVLLATRFLGRRLPITERSLFTVLLAYPAMTLKVILAIHWEALRIWLRGVPTLRAPRPDAFEGPIAKKRRE